MCRLAMIQTNPASVRHMLIIGLFITNGIFMIYFLYELFNLSPDFVLNKSIPSESILKFASG